ncbi:MAG: hypothetical protein MJZ06_00775 [Bacteroidaceae bacterium]|nr:hypothetical protein [Bacteroidaceae bacterium]
MEKGRQLRVVQNTRPTGPDYFSNWENYFAQSESGIRDKTARNPEQLLTLAECGCIFVTSSEGNPSKAGCYICAFQSMKEYLRKYQKEGYNFVEKKSTTFAR